MKSQLGMPFSRIGSPLITAIFLLFTLISLRGAEGAQLPLYIVPDTTTIISGASPSTANLNNNNTTDKASYTTTLSRSPSGSYGTNIQGTYSKNSWSTMGYAYYTEIFATDYTIAAGATGNFWVNSPRTNDSFEFTLWDYDTINHIYTQIPTTPANGTVTGSVSSNGTTTQISGFFKNNQWTVFSGHVLAVKVRFWNGSNTSTRQAIIYCNSTTMKSRINADIQFSMTATADTNSNITSSGMTTATVANSPVVVYNSYNSSRTYTVNADIGYNITHVYLNSVDLGAVASGTQYPFSSINRNHSISVSTTPNLNNFTINQNTGGHVTVGSYDCTNSSCIYSLPTNTHTFTITPYANYSVYGISFNGVAQAVPGGQTSPYAIPITVPAITILTVDFEHTIDVTSSTGTGGTISPAGITAVPYGQSLTFDIVPAYGYRIFSITDNGTNKGNTSPYTINNIREPHNVVATFLPLHHIQATAGPNGNISPVGNVLVDNGTDRNFTVGGNLGFKVSNVQVDGVSLGPVTSYNFTNVTSDHTISATFETAPLASSYCAIPPFITTGAPANVMLMLSVETPMEGPANPSVSCSGNPNDINFTCSATSGGCGNGILGCYDNTRTYYGYFETGKCYTYSGSGSTGLFSPSGAASNHQCGGTAWSGNYLNWATMLAVDAFRKAFTGGNRDAGYDTTTDTVILAARHQSGWFQDPISISAADAPLYTPYAEKRYLKRSGLGQGFAICKNDSGGNPINCAPTTSASSGEHIWPVADSNTHAVFSLRIKACDSTGGAETRCNSTNNKPEGTIQKYMDKMRFALMSYAAIDDADRDGGVLRANMKWVGPTIPAGLKYHEASGNIQTCNDSAGCNNPLKEVDSNGIFQNNPDGATGANSGVINYINKFAYTSGYKSHDPMGEMYYQVLRYFMNLTPSVGNYCDSLTDFTASYADGFAFYCNSSKTNAWGWRDPSLYPCSQNFVIAINDANPWLDKRIPGSAFKAKYYDTTSYADWCGSSTGNCDADFLLNGTQVDVEGWTNKVGDSEGFTGKTFSSASRMFGCEVDSTGVCIDGFNSDGKSITLSKLGRIVGTPPWPGKENSYNVAGLAYFAHVNDLRPDLTTLNPNGRIHNLTTYMIDTQEPQSNMLVGPKNMLYLAAKYGGFDDKDNDKSVQSAARITRPLIGGVSADRQ